MNQLAQQRLPPKKIMDFGLSPKDAPHGARRALQGKRGRVHSNELAHSGIGVWDTRSCACRRALNRPHHSAHPHRTPQLRPLMRAPAAPPQTHKPQQPAPGVRRLCGATPDHLLRAPGVHAAFGQLTLFAQPRVSRTEAKCQRTFDNKVSSCCFPFSFWYSPNLLATYWECHIESYNDQWRSRMKRYLTNPQQTGRGLPEAGCRQRSLTLDCATPSN